MFVTTTGVVLQFFINDVEIPLDISNVESMLIVNNIYDRLPTLRITINDDKNIFNSIQLFDGLKFSILIGNKQGNDDMSKKEDDLAYMLTFSIISAPEYTIRTTQSKITLYGVYNNIKLWKDKKPLSISGTSNEAIAYIMKQHDIKYQGVKTNDSMVWHNFGKSQIDFIHDITERAYINDKSCMLSFFNYDGTFKLINVNAYRKPKYLLTNVGTAVSEDKIKTVEDVYYYTDLNYNYQSGIDDYSYTYKNKSLQYSFMKENTAFEIDNNNQNTKYQSKENSLIKLNSLYSKALNINEIDYSLADRINLSIDGINVGNTHQNWNKAKFQNLRYKSLFNIYCEIYLPEISAIDVGDMVTINLSSANRELKDVFNYENWFVEAKTLALSVNQYTEKLLLSTTGFSNNIWKNNTNRGFSKDNDGATYI